MSLHITKIPYISETHPKQNNCTSFRLPDTDLYANLLNNRFESFVNRTVTCFVSMQSLLQDRSRWSSITAGIVDMLVFSTEKVERLIYYFDLKSCVFKSYKRTLDDNKVSWTSLLCTTFAKVKKINRNIFGINIHSILNVYVRARSLGEMQMSEF